MIRERSIWLLKHRRAGDLAQMRHLAAMLGNETGTKWTVAEKRIAFRVPGLVRFPGSTRWLLDTKKSDSLEPPWPDAIIVAEAVAAKIASELKQRSDGRIKTIVLGRPAGRTEGFDLVLTTAQYGLRPAPNVVELPLPLAVTPSVTNTETQDLLRRMAGKPRPWLAVLVGGGIPPDLLDENAIAQLADAALGERQRHGGSLIVLTSPRTGARCERELQDRLGSADLLMPWDGMAKTNLYGAVLAEADRFMVTSDSISMAVEAINTGKPVSILMLPQQTSLGYAIVTALDRHAGLGVSNPAFPWKPVSLLFRHGVIEPPANRPRFYRELVERGVLAIYSEFPATPATGLFDEARATALAAVRKLLA